MYAEENIKMKDKLFSHKTDLFFDLDHTLWDFERNSGLAFEAVINELKLPFTIDEFLSHYVDINTEYWHRYSLDQITHDELKIGRIRDTFELLNYKSNLAEIEVVGKQYLHLLPEFNYLLPGANEILDYLEGKYKMHIITNGFSEVQERKLQNSGISNYFTTVTDSELAGVKKPDAYIFNYALQQANVTKKEALMIGDNLKADIQGAQSVGIDTVFYNEHFIKTELQTVEVNTLLELKNLL